MAIFFCRLIPPRPSFANDMTGEEAALMQAHAAYWTHGIEARRAVAFGFVADARGPFGMGIVECDDRAAAEEFTSQDPVILADRNFRYEVSAMPRGISHR
jgi:hypothetical protein